MPTPYIARISCVRVVHYSGRFHAVSCSTQQHKCIMQTTFSRRSIIADSIQFVLLVVLLIPSAVNFSHSEQCPASSSSPLNDSVVVALVLARGGSKGIPGKNLRTIGGISLLARALQSIRDSDSFGEVWVSTDDDRIAIEAERYGASVHFRPASVSNDHSTSIESVQEFLQHHPHVRNVALVQCTSPFIRTEYLRRAIVAFGVADISCVFAVTRSFKLRWQRDLIDQRLVAANFNPLQRPRRQDWAGELIETGMFYVATVELLRRGRFQNDRCECVEVAAEDSLEIDTPADLELARYMYKRKLRNVQ